MTRSMKNQWKLSGNQAHYAWNDLDLHIDVARPNQGIEFHRQGDRQAQFLFQTTQVSTIAHENLDPYARGSDLIVAYPCSENRLIGGELSWRVRTHLDREELGGATDDEDDSAGTREGAGQGTDGETKVCPFVSVELLYSLQTLLLDSRPNPRLESRLYGESIKAFQLSRDLSLQPHQGDSAPAAWLIRQGDQSLLLTVMPSDALVLNVCTAEGAANGPHEYLFEWDLDADFLEKGVIRRLRAFAVTGQHEEAIIQAANDFFVSEVPLTA